MRREEEKTDIAGAEVPFGVSGRQQLELVDDEFLTERPALAR